MTRRGGHASGAGSPVFFHCPGWRKSDWRNRDDEHEVLRLGRTRPYRPSVGHAMGARSMFTAHQYECLTCGYVGWTNHIGILDHPLKEAL